MNDLDITLETLDSLLHMLLQEPCSRWVQLVRRMESLRKDVQVTGTNHKCYTTSDYEAVRVELATLGGWRCSLASDGPLSSNQLTMTTTADHRGEYFTPFANIAGEIT